MSFSACSISSGSSGSSSICACPRIVAKASLRGSERALARVASHVDRFGELRDRQLDFAPVIARPNAHVARVVWLEPGRFHVNRVATGLEQIEIRVPARAGLHRDGRRADRRRRPDVHLRADDHRAARIDDRDAKRAPTDCAIATTGTDHPSTSRRRAVSCISTAHLPDPSRAYAAPTSPRTRPA